MQENTLGALRVNETMKSNSVEKRMGIVFSYFFFIFFLFFFLFCSLRIAYYSGLHVEQ